MSLIAVLTTIDDADLASNLARELVSRKLAACVQVSPIRSIYRWQGEVQEDSEFRLLIKTTSAKYPEVEALIRELHSYELPAISAFDLTHASEAFADWVETSCE